MASDLQLGYTRVSSFPKSLTASYVEKVKFLTQLPWLPDDSADNTSRIRLMHHDPRWRQEFEQTRSGILQCCEGRVVEVEHIGSTSISGLIARPIIDAVAVVADPVDLREAEALIEGLSFRRTELPGWIPNGPPQQIMLEKPRHGEITHRVFLVTQGSPLLHQTTEMREFLRSTHEMAIELEEAKVELWRQCEGEPNAYAAGMAIVFDRFRPSSL